MSEEKTLFEKIMEGEIPGHIEFEDDRCIILKDINPQAPVHCLVIPKRVITRIDQAQEEDEALLGHLLLVAKQYAKDKNLDAGFRLVINNGKQAGESVPHLHVHLLAGRPMTWPPG